jgi:hypothetical protein
VVRHATLGVKTLQKRQRSSASHWKGEKHIASYLRIYLEPGKNQATGQNSTISWDRSGAKEKFGK